MGYRTNILSIDTDKVQEFKDKLNSETDIYEYLKTEYELGDYNVDKSELTNFSENYHSEINIIEDVKSFIFNIIKSFRKDIMESYEIYEKSESKTKRFLHSRKIFWEMAEDSLTFKKENNRDLSISAIGLLEFEIFELMSIYNNLDENKTYLLISG